MDIEVKTGTLEEEARDLAAIFTFKSEKMPKKPVSLGRINKTLNGSIEPLFEDKEFSGEKGQITVVHTHGRLKTKRLVLVGLGEKKKFNIDMLRNASAIIAEKARDMKLGGFTIELPEEVINVPVTTQTEALVTGAYLSLYRFEKYLPKDDKKPALKHMRFVTKGRNSQKVKKSAERAMIIAEGVNLARDIANDSGEQVHPKNIGLFAQRISRKHGIKCQILDEKVIRKQKMGGLLNVGKGSINPPRLVVMEYGSKKNTTVALVGKGIVFDSGGLSLKPSKGMEEMKSDKSGAATVIGTVVAAARLKLPVHLIGITPLAENMPSGKSYKPGDVIHTLSGKNVEVLNTDAEGRLILADGITYAKRYKPKYIVDIATLTGACVVALGKHAAGVFGNDKTLIKNLRDASEASGEKLWEFPLYEEYFEQIKSEIADVRNVGGRDGGAITAAAFLGTFAESDKWAHVDVAGTAWSTENKGYNKKGATGFGVRLFLEFLARVK